MAGAMPLDRGRRVTVGQWLFVLVAALFVGPLFISNLWGYLKTRRAWSAAAEQNLREVAVDEAAATEELVRRAVELVPSLVARAPGLLDEVAAASGSPDARQRLHELLQRAGVGAVELDELSVVAAGGEVLASSRATQPRADLAAALCLGRGRTEPALVGFDGGAGGPQLLVATPVAAGGAVFCARFRLSRYGLDGTARGRARGAIRLLLDQDRRVLAAAPVGAVGELVDWLPRTAGREAWSARGRGPDGVALSIAYRPVPGPGWAVVVAVPVDATLSELDSLKRQALVGFATLVAVAALAIFLTWRTLVRPMRAVAAAAERIADGGAAGATVAPSGPRELIELTTAFNRMSLGLRESHDTLADRIAARTRELRDSEEFLELLLNSIEQRVIVTDREFRIVKANNAAERMHGPEVLGAICHELFEGRAAPCDDCPVARTLATGVPSSAERSQHTVDGQVPLSIATYPVRSDGGAIDSVIAISRVTSREKQSQAQLAFQEKMAALGQLAAGVAHELGNPLASIDAQLQRAERDPAGATTAVPIVRKEVARMARMLRELVDLSRRKRDRVGLAAPNQIVDDVVRLIEHDPRARNVVIERDLAEGLPAVRLSEDQLVQVLLNLGLNALDALASGGVVRFATVAEGDQVAIRVIDTGAGIVASARSRLFEPFFTTKPPGRGTGLGLFVSRRIIEELGGRLELEASTPGHTVFAILLPAVPVEDP